MVNVQDGTVSRGVPFTRTYASQHANQTKVTINFKPTSSVGTNATGVQVWTDDQPYTFRSVRLSMVSARRPPDMWTARKAR